MREKSTKLIIIASALLIVLTLPFAAAEPICALTEINVCVNATSGTGDGTNLGFDGTTASCTQLGGTYIDDPGGFYGIDAASFCGVRCCCDANNAPRVNNPQVPASLGTGANVCGSGFTAQPQFGTSPATSCDTVCAAAVVPPPPACPVGNPAGGTCSCGTYTLSQGMTCCANGPPAGVGQTCAAAPVCGNNVCDSGETATSCPLDCTPTCQPNQLSTSACMCGTTQMAADNVCCTGGTIAPTLAACPVTPVAPSSCGNLIYDAGEQCDAPYVLPSNVPSTWRVCQPVSGVPHACTAQCTCVPLTDIVCGNGICSAGESQVCANSNGIVADCPAPSVCTSVTGLPAPISPNAIYNSNTNSVTINWVKPQQCYLDLLSITIGRSNQSATAAQTSPQAVFPGPSPTAAPTFIDTSVPVLSSSALYYSINFHYRNTGNASAVATVNVPSQFCPLPSRSYCASATQAVSCDANYNVVTANCTGSQVCVFINGVAQCLQSGTTATANGECDKCNGLYSMFPDDTQTITETNPVTLTLSPLTCDMALTCFRDIRTTSAELYSSCQSINSCAGYRTEFACTQDNCQKGSGSPCSWRVLDSQTGKGVCGTNNQFLAPLTCTDCDATGTCDRITCEAIGQTSPNSASFCAYVGTVPSSISNVIRGPSATCMATKDVPCEYLPDRNSCVGNPGVAYNIDVTYSSGLRTAGDHSILSSSNDSAGHGKCVWFNQNSYQGCYKDADMDAIPDLLGQYPQGISSYTLSLDFTSPTSSILAVPGSAFPRTFNVRYATDGTDLFVCFANATSAPCYPTSTAEVVKSSKIIRKDFTAADSGDWIMYYYAIDAARNLEVVKSFPFTIDGAPPVITIQQPVLNLLRYNNANPPEMRNRVSILFNVNKNSYCNTTLQDITGTTVSASDRGATSGTTDLTNQYGRNFGVTYPALKDGTYNFLVTCSDTSGNIATATMPLSAGTNGDIYNPKPVIFTPTKNTTINISIQTSKQGICRYGAYGQSYSQMTQYTQTGGLLHTANVTVPASGQYTYQTICDFQSVLVTGDDSDLIVFAVDVSPPVSRLCSNDDNCGPLSSGVANSTLSTYTARILCQDQPTSSPDFGCGQIFACVGLMSAAPCSPTSRTLTTLGSDKYATIQLDAKLDQRLRYYSVDAGGNTESVQEINTDVMDFTPPARPLFTLID